MKLSVVFLLLVSNILLISWNDATNWQSSDTIIATGQMPNIAKDKSGKLHLVYGIGDSIMYLFSSDHGNTFSKPGLIARLPRLAASHTRGPQIAATNNGLVVTACTNSGNIFSYQSDAYGKWSQAVKVNDIDTVAKENLMALSADGENAFAVWLDLRDKHNKLYGAKSIDGGKTWNKNILVYASPDPTVCECCKPSVVVKENKVYVMFRNWLNGNRDLYLIQSNDAGASFGQAQKIGMESWKLSGCPMDGGSIVINQNGNPETVWNRKGTIYACEPGKEERPLGQGRSCTLETINGKNVYAWLEKGEVVVLNSQRTKQVIGKGILPILKAVNNDKVLCIWEDNKQIRKSILSI